MDLEHATPAHPHRRILRTLLLWTLALLALIQIVPYGRIHWNPPMRSEPAWDSPQTAALARRACYDCHSNQTVWPWYSNVAPISWLLQHDVDEGRHELNFSDWNAPQRKAKEAAEVVRKGDMPMWIYTAVHPGARLSSDEREALRRGLAATVSQRGAQPAHHDD